MRVFVVGTGRCGTVTFYQACMEIANYTAGHESKNGEDQIGDWSFPDNHAEVSCNLLWGIPALRERYPKAFWVHLTRERAACVDSLRQNCSRSQEMFAQQWWFFRHEVDPNRRARIAETYYDSYNALVRRLLPPTALTLQLESIRESWPEFWEKIGAQGDLAASLLHWGRKYNARGHRARDKYIPVQP